MAGHVEYWTTDDQVILQRTLRRPDAAVFNLTGFTVTAIVEGVGVANPSDSPFAVTVSDAANGIVQWTLRNTLNNILNLAGRYNCQFRATNGTIDSRSEMFEVVVKAGLVGS